MDKQPTKAPVNTDSDLVPQHKRIAEGQKPNSGGSNDKGAPTKW